MVVKIENTAVDSGGCRSHSPARNAPGEPDIYPVSRGAPHVPSLPGELADAGQADRRCRFDELYAAHNRQVLGYLLRRTASTDDAADVFAETFLTAWRRLDDLPAGQQAGLWLYGTARRTLANFRRGERRRLALADRLRADLSGYQPREQEGELAEITAAFRGLAEPDRELLALVAWEGLDPGQVAAVLGCSPNAARIRLHRARRRLAQTLASGDLHETSPAPARAYIANGDIA
jgi:RNA polymerase sigma-70 factor (ECF subfamily)